MMNLTRKDIALNASKAAARNKKGRPAIVINMLSKSYKRTPEADLMFSILARAILDLCAWLDTPPCNRSKSTGLSLLEYFDGEIVHAEIIGIDSDYVKRLLKKHNLII